MYFIQDSLKKAQIFSKETESTSEKLKETTNKIKRIQSSYDVTKKSVRDKLKPLLEKLNSIELKIAIISKEKGENDKENEDKTVKISVFDSNDVSNIENNLST